MGLPNILIEFKTKASTAIQRGERGIVAIIVKETTNSVKEFETAAKVTGYTAANEAYIKRTFLGGVKPIKKVIVIATDTIANGLAKAETVKFDYLVGTPELTASEATEIASAIKSIRDNKYIKVKAVLPNNIADHEGIINFATTNIVVGTDTFTSAQYCSRIAGLLAGTPLQESATYKVLSEVNDVPKKTKAELDTAINAGNFEIFWDGEKVKVARAVNSLTTLGSTKSEDMKSIKIIDIMDMIYNDVKMTCEDNYIGKHANNYDNKCNLIVAIKTYLESLKREELLNGDIYVGIDMAAQKDYLSAKGVDTESMNDLNIKKADTGTNVYLEGKYKITNAIEDISIKFYV
ncbi:MAG TPA: phage tail sheath protein [Flavobacteriaceae bacterium]|nr:phage tail sheath protein [Flavobacteriaceae bacterium]